LAQSYARLGVQISLLSSSQHLLPNEDTDLSAVLQQQLIDEGIQLYLNSTIQRIFTAENKVNLAFTDASQQTNHLDGSHLLIATGRQPNITGLNLATIGLKIEKQQIIVDRRLRTSQKNIYACGDLVSPYKFTHMAEHQAGVVLKNALFHWPAKVEQQVIPHCTFTDPELASVGLTEHAAIYNGTKHRSYTVPFNQIDRAITDNNTIGFAKVICSPTGKLLGAHIVGPQAGELIGEFVLALKQGLNLSAISKTIHIYPTLSQINRRVADQHLKTSLTPTTRKLLKWIFRLQGN
jgi:pyruvate/2-oxoglutarate dehydrogenase complex dihydrolipoamide dehydrogenase (E3) component